jgi:hypothetical protein
MRLSLALQSQKSRMKNLFIPSTPKTPEIDFKINGQLKITGNSYPENVNEFYTQVTDWLEQFLFSSTEKITINVDLKYINTSSIKYILNIITKVQALSKSEVNVAWLYEMEDEDMHETGEDLERLTQIKFDFIEKQLA